jgi:hypothetical protein
LMSSGPQPNTGASARFAVSWISIELASEEFAP